MRFVIYESMFGNTRQVAEAIGAGLGDAYDVTVLPVDDATPELVAGAELVVVGGPTHAHGMSRTSTRKAAREMAAKPENDITVASGTSTGVREWVAELRHLPTAVAAFDTRVDAPAALTGRASRSIARMLRRTGAHLVEPPESFLVTKQNRLVDGELDRARAWGERLASQVAAARIEVGSE